MAGHHQHSIQLKHIRVLIIDIFAKLCDTENGIDNLMENNRDYYYLAEDLPTISQITEFNKYLVKYLDNFSNAFSNY